MSNPANGLTGPSPLTYPQLQALARSYETTSDLRRVLLSIIDHSIQQATALQLLVGLVEKGATK